MGNAHVYVQIYYRHMYTCGYIFNAPEAGSAYMYTCRHNTGTCIRAKIYILWLIIYYLILLNLTLANPHTELAMARLSSPANTTTISNNYPQNSPPPPEVPPPGGGGGLTS